MVLVLIFCGVLFVGYDVLLMVTSAGTLLNTIVSFSHVWSLAGLFLIALTLYKKRTGHVLFANGKRTTKRVLLGTVSAGAIVFFVHLVLILSPTRASSEQAADYLVLLGGGVNRNGELSPTTKNRVRAASEYLSAHEQTICVVSGGKTPWAVFPESPALKRELIQTGISGERILEESAALDTIQNLQFSCAVLASYAGTSEKAILASDVVLVSNYFHLRRAERLAKRMGFTHVSGIGAPCAWYMRPHLYLREICAYAKLNLRILFTGKPQPIA